ncbi:hypothetical protein CEN48_21790, partial [Fischerella thermalis CCMEE 5282]
MKVWLEEQKLTRVTVSIATLTAFIAVATVSCARSNEVLVTEIGVNPPKSPTSKPSKAGDFYIQGQYRHIKGDPQGAIAAYTEAIKLNPQYAEAYNGRGLVHFDLGDKQKAIAD